MSEDHPVDVLLKFRYELNDDRQLTYNQGQCRSDAITWLLNKCEEQALVLAMLRNADAQLEQSTDLAVRLEAQATKDNIYAEIDRSRK